MARKDALVYLPGPLTMFDKGMELEYKNGRGGR